MNELIQISKVNINGAEVNSVNSRDIYDYLKIGRHYADWIKSSIDKYGFEDNLDFTIHKFVIGKNTQLDYIVTLDMAKELCMVSNTDKGKEVRRYFIHVEKESKRPLSFEEMAKLTIIEADKKIKELTSEIEENKPKVAFAMALEKTVSSIDFEFFSKVLYKENGIMYGRANLMKWFRNNGYLTIKNLPMQRMINAGYLIVEEKVYLNKKTNEYVPYSQTKITGKGQIYFTQKLLEDLCEVAS